MPCLNEALTIGTCIQKARGCIARLGLRAEVVVADNGSTDGSPQIAESEGARVVHVPERGYGAALYHGAKHARGRYIIMGDGDDSYDFSRLDPFVEQLRVGVDLVMGNRFLGGIAPGAMPWKNKHIGNPVLSRIGRLFFHSPVRDFHCGLRGFSRAAFERMDLQTTGMEFASEMVIKATLLDMRIAEVPTTLSKDGRDRPPHLRPWRDGWRHFRFMLLYSPRWLFLYPGLALMLGGALVSALLLPGPFTLGGSVVLDVHTLLFAVAAILLGFRRWSTRSRRACTRSTRNFCWRILHSSASWIRSRWSQVDRRGNAVRPGCSGRCTVSRSVEYGMRALESARQRSHCDPSAGAMFSEVRNEEDELFAPGPTGAWPERPPTRWPRTVGAALATPPSRLSGHI